MNRIFVFALVAELLTGSTTPGWGSERGGGAAPGKGEDAMATTHASRTVSVSINCPPDQVYEFASNPENLPKWAKGLGNAVTRRGTAWIVETAQGPMTVQFAERNRFGVLDHYVTTPAGETVYVPLRVLANGSGSEVIFTLFRLPDMSDDQFAADARLVEQDLATLKKLMERR